MIEPTAFKLQTQVSPEAFIASVLSRAPRLAVFDCDGTLWNMDSGEGFFYWELEGGLVPADVAAWARPRYESYRRGEVDEEAMCGEMVTINRGVSWAGLERAGAEYFQQHVIPVIFPEMRELVRRLISSGCELWAISSTNEWVVWAGAEYFGIPRERVLAAAVRENGGFATDQLIRVPTDELKAVAVREVIQRPPDAVFGNSMHDFHMMELAKNAYAINPNPDLADAARARGWEVYQPQTH